MKSLILAVGAILIALVLYLILRSENFSTHFEATNGLEGHEARADELLGRINVNNRGPIADVSEQWKGYVNLQLHLRFACPKDVRQILLFRNGEVIFNQSYNGFDGKPLSIDPVNGPFKIAELHTHDSWTHVGGNARIVYEKTFKPRLISKDSGARYRVEVTFANGSSKRGLSGWTPVFDGDGKP